MRTLVATTILACSLAIAGPARGDGSVELLAGPVIGTSPTKGGGELEIRAGLPLSADLQGDLAVGFRYMRAPEAAYGDTSDAVRVRGQAVKLTLGIRPQTRKDNVTLYLLLAAGIEHQRVQFDDVANLQSDPRPARAETTRETNFLIEPGGGFLVGAGAWRLGAQLSFAIPVREKDPYPIPVNDRIKATPELYLLGVLHRVL